jgi:PAS domain S-box-containing protein
LSENRFRLFFQSIPQALIVFDEETFHILDVNTAACEVFGYSHEEFTSLTVDDLLPPEDRSALALAARRPGDPAADLGITGRRQLRDGSIIDVEVTSYSFPLDERRVSLSIIRNVTEQRAVQSALQAGEERLRIIADVTTDAIWDRDLTTDAVAWSAGLSSLFGYDDNGDHPHDWWIAHVHPDDRTATESSIEALFASDHHHWSGEYRFLRADGRYANVLDRGAVIRDEDGRPVRFVGAMVDISEQLHAAEAVAKAAHEERRRLAQDLHDSVTQSLYSVSLMAEAARRRSAAGEQQVTAEFIARLGELSRQALRQLRLLVYELRPGVLEQEGLAGVLQHRLEAVERRAGIQAHLIEENETPIPPTLQGELFRIAQEALNNALKHASATAVTVRLGETAGDIILEVADNGRGFDVTMIGAAGGLAAMRRRVESLGGRLDILPQSGGGVVVRARVPHRND